MLVLPVAGSLVRALALALRVRALLPLRVSALQVLALLPRPLRVLAPRALVLPPLVELELQLAYQPQQVASAWSLVPGWARLSLFRE